MKKVVDIKIQNNKEIRYKGRKEQSICDGFAIQFFNGSPKNNSGNINIILRNLDVIEYKNGAQLLRIESSKAMNALGNTRNELTHCIFEPDSLGSYIDNPNTETDNMVNLYAFLFWKTRKAFRRGLCVTYECISPNDRKITESRTYNLVVKLLTLLLTGSNNLLKYALICNIHLFNSKE